MAFRFRKSFKIAPGVKLNINKNSTSLTFGGKGAHYTINSEGKRTKSIGIPGTGLYYTDSSSCRKNKAKRKGKDNYSKEGSIVNKEDNNMEKKKWYQKTWVIILLLIYLFPVGIYLMWKYTGWKKGVKTVITAIWALYLGFGVLGISMIDSESITQPTTFSEITTEFILSETTTEATTETTSETTAVTTTEYIEDIIIYTTEETTEEYTETENFEESTGEEEYFEDYSETETYESYSDDEYYYEEDTEEEYYEEESYEDEYYEEEYYEEEADAEMVWITATGSKYHSIPDCGNTKTSRQVSLETAQKKYSACSKCW